MLQIGDELGCLSAVLLLALLTSRSALCSSLFAASLYVFLLIFHCPPVPADRAKRVLRPERLGGGVPVVAHRAAGHDAPENTLAAIREARLNGATGVELDLEFTADGVPVLMHDKTVDRTTNGSGLLSALRFSEVSKLDASAKHRLRDRFHGERVPTLQEAIKECIRHQLTIFFNVKGHPDEAVAALREMYRTDPILYNCSIVCSFEPKVIYKMRQADPEVVTALTHRPWSLSQREDGTPRFSSLWKHYWLQLLDVLLDWAHHHLLWDLCGVSAFLVHRSVISPDYVKYWAGRRVELIGWTINSAVEKQYYGEVLNISYLTDCLREDCGPAY